jgi:hypothetical protein
MSEPERLTKKAVGGASNRLHNVHILKLDPHASWGPIPICDGTAANFPKSNGTSDDISFE